MSAGEVRIVKLAPSEWTKYRELRLRALKEDSPAFGASYEDEAEAAPEEWRADLETAMQPRGTRMLFAQRGDNVVGMIGAFFSERAKTDHIATIFGVYVAPEARGLGIGTRLLAAILAEIEANPAILKVKLTVNTRQRAAIQLYQRAGFTIVGTLAKELKIEGEFYDEYVMEKFFPR